MANGMIYLCAGMAWYGGLLCEYSMCDRVKNSAVFFKEENKNKPGKSGIRYPFFYFLPHTSKTMDEELGQRPTKVQPGGPIDTGRRPPQHHLSLPETSGVVGDDDGKKADDLGNMYAAYNLLRRVASPVVNGQNQQRPLHIGNPAVLGKVQDPSEKEIMQSREFKRRLTLFHSLHA